MLQHGPVQWLNLLRSFDVLNVVHLTWSQAKHLEHCTAVEPTDLVHTGQNQGPGFCSIPALIRRSQIRQAGFILFFVRQVKNTF